VTLNVVIAATPEFREERIVADAALELLLRL
jgi:hypothetical protein